MDTLRVGSLYTGAAIGDVGYDFFGAEHAFYVEHDEWCQEHLKRRIEDGWLDDAPIWDDVTTFDGRPWRGHVDLLVGGFPCQPFSLAGRQRREDDERNMWPDTARLIREIRPPVAFLENVSGLRSGENPYLEAVLGELAEGGYNAIWDCIAACGVGAPHQRERLWIIAWDSNADSGRFEEYAKRYGQSFRRLFGKSRGDAGRLCDVVPDSRRPRRWENPGSARRDEEAYGGRSTQDHQPTGAHEGDGSGEVPGNVARRTTEPSDRRTRWFAEPPVGRLANGCPDRVDRLRALGNGQVPHQMALAFAVLSGRMFRALEVGLELEFPVPFERRGLETIGFDVRQIRKAQELGITTIRDLREWDGELVDIPYVGSKTAHSANEVLNS